MKIEQRRFMYGKPEGISTYDYVFSEFDKRKKMRNFRDIQPASEQVQKIDEKVQDKKVDEKPMEY